VIDLHCHLLPGIDDGAPNLEVALAMARCAAVDGIQVMACTPHIYPGLYENKQPAIAAAIVLLQASLDAEGIPLQLTIGADTHVAPNLVDDLRAGQIPTLAGSRYFLLEPPHHVLPPRFEQLVFQLLIAGYVPIITHPERLTWIETHYGMFGRLAQSGAWMQLTAGSLTGRFGRRPRYWADRMLDEGLVDILATDAHDMDRRPPLLAEARDAAAERVGMEEAKHMVSTRPRGVLDNAPAASLPQKHRPALPPAKSESLWRRLAGR
jgi:protein-tyrosine phosphatase